MLQEWPPAGPAKLWEYSKGAGHSAPAVSGTRAIVFHAIDGNETVDCIDTATGERLDNLEDPYRLFRCHTIMNCVDVCPKGLNPTAAIGKIKELLVKRTV